MKKLISFKQAAFWSRAIFLVLAIMHLVVVIGIVGFDFAPTEFLWGGRLQTSDELLQFELVSLGMMLLCWLAVSIRAYKFGAPKLLRPSRILMWLLTILFAFNTAGNLLATSTFEKLFAIITLALVFFCLRLALEPISK